MSNSNDRGWFPKCCRLGERISPHLTNAFLVLLLLATPLPTGTANAQSSDPVHSFSECETVEEDLLQDEVNRLIQSVLEKESSGLDVNKIVFDKWKEIELDKVVNRAVDSAIARVRREEGTLNVFLSGWDSNRVRELAKKVAKYSFGSPNFRDGIDALSLAIASELTLEIHLMTVTSASSALICVQEFIGTTFSGTMSRALEDHTRDWIEEIDLELANSEGYDDLVEYKAALAGLGIILGTQIAHKLAGKVAQGILAKVVTRVLGKAATSAIPVAGWVIGSALILMDFFNALEGSLPQIRADFKKENVKKTIRREIATIVEEEFDAALPEIAKNVTSEIFEQWQMFLQDFEHVLRLAERNKRFRHILDGVTVDQVGKLSVLVAIGNEVLGTTWLNHSIDTGEFDRILALPIISFEILRDTSEPELVLAWAELADVRIVNVVETELYKIASPAKIGDRGTLERILALEDAFVIQDLMQKSMDEREALLRLPTMQTKWILAELSKPEVDWLVPFLLEMPTTSQGRLVDFVIRERGLISLVQETEDLRSKFVAVLDLAGEYERVETILNSTTAEQVEKLSALVEVASEVLELDQIGTMIESGQFEEVFSLPQISLDILRATGNPTSVLGWARLAGEGIGQVVETGLYLVSELSAFRGRQDLEHVLAIEHPIAIQRIMILEQEERDALLSLPPEEARELLLTGFSEEVLSWMATYLRDLPASDQQLFAKYVVTSPELIPILRNSNELAGKFPRVLNLASKVLNLRGFLEDTSAKDIEKLTDLVVTVEDSLDSAQQTEFFESVQLEQTFSLPQLAFEILRSSRDPALVIAWAKLAGPLVVQVSESELFKVASPDHLGNRAELAKALSLHDPEALKWVLQLNAGERSYFLSSLSVAEVLWLDEFRSGLPDNKTVLLAPFIHQNPALMEELGIERIGQLVRESKDIEVALALVADRIGEPRTLWPTVPMLSAIQAVFYGNVPLALFGHFYLAQSLFLLTALLGIIALALLLWWINRRWRFPEFWNHLRRSSGGRT